MKKLLSLVAGLVMGSALYALPVLNPAGPALLTDGVFMCDQNDCWGIKFGYRGDFVFDKHMKSAFGGHHKDFSLYANEGVLTLNLWDRLDIYGFVGAANMSEDDLRYITGAESDEFIFHYNTRTIAGVGIKAVLWETCWGSYGTTYVGIDGQYEWLASSPVSRVTRNGDSEGSGDFKREYREGQVSLAIGHRICNLIPYVAAKWSNGRAPLNGTSVTVDGIGFDDISATRHWGYAVGLSLVDAGRMSVTAEARFIDETAFTISGDIRF
ncbi:MAG: hypothetical protein P4L16_00445 [Chlamydiales bacterium]|nr:hypothetical protein [Chlamydiales bacterium]